MPILVNLKKQRCDIYIGRGSIYGNPYLIGRDGSREDVIRKYKTYFYDKLARNSQFKQAVDWLKGREVTLGCYCSPLPCHGDVILEYLSK
jgi:hypothetical protein